MQAGTQQLIASLAVGILAAVPLAAVAADGNSDGDPPTSSRMSSELSERFLAVGVWTSRDGATVTYEAEYFDTYTVVSAADMLRWVLAGRRCCRTIIAVAEGNRKSAVSAPAETRC